MIAFSQNFPNYDIGLDANGVLAFVSGKEAYANVIADAVRTLIGELQLNIEGGIPWMDSVFNEIGDTSLWQHRVREVIEGFDFVDSIDSFVAEYNFATKTLKYQITISTNEGIVEVSNG
jgi:hypothetical protein